MAYTGNFQPPGPGAWERESTHMSRPVSRWLGHIMPAAFVRGFREGMAHYGMLLDHLEPAVVEGFMYVVARPVGAPKNAKGPPPKPIFKLMTWLHPEIRRRIRRSEEVFRTKAWREDAARWDREWKPRIAKKNAALQAIDPKTLDTAALVRHLGTLREAVSDGVTTHHRFNGTCMLPTGDYLAHAREWTGLSARELLAPFRGASPVSAGASKELSALADALRADEVARAILEKDAPPKETLDALCAGDGKTAKAARAYLDAVGLRVISGYDVADRCAIEMPEILVRAIRSALEGDLVKRDHDRAAEIAKIRDKVPTKHRAELDERLEEALAVFRIRDERCYLNDAMTNGIARRSLLEAGARLASEGKLHDASHVVDLTPDELEAALTKQPTPSKDEIAAYAKWRETKTIHDAPEYLGHKPSGPPPADWLPPHAARAQRAIDVVLQAMFETAKEKSDATVIRGLGAGGGCYEGEARLVLDPASFARVQRGDVLVARITSPSYNVVLPLLGAIVTDRGGLLSHPAIVAREYGLPAVVGANVATAKISDGARVRVDGDKGEVHVLSGARS